MLVVFYVFLFFLLLLRQPPGSALFPYTTLFRSVLGDGPRRDMDVHGVVLEEALRHTELRVVRPRSEEHTSELQSRGHLVCRLLLEKKKTSRPRLRLSESITPIFYWLHKISAA